MFPSNPNFLSLQTFILMRNPEESGQVEELQIRNELKIPKCDYWLN